METIMEDNLNKWDVSNRRKTHYYNMLILLKVNQYTERNAIELQRFYKLIPKFTMDSRSP